jgi:hypothetical protein
MKAMKVVFAFRNEVDQNKVGEKHSKFYGNTAYTEPLKNVLQLSYQINNNSGNSNFITYDLR